MKNNPILQRPVANMSLPRNGFPRGFEVKFNQSSGMAVPIFSEVVFGGTACRINRKELLRASQVNTAAMPSVDHHIDFYFVPFRQLVTNYGQMRSQVSDSFSTAMAGNAFKPDTRLPMINQTALLGVLQSMEQSQLRDMIGFLRLPGAIRLLDMLNYGVTLDVLEANGERLDSDAYFGGMSDINPLRLCAYQKIWYDHYRQSNYISNKPQAYNLDMHYSTAGIMYRGFDATELLDLLELHYVPLRKDYYTNIYPSLNYVGVNQGNVGNFKIPDSIQGFGTSINEQFDFDRPDLSSASTNRIPTVVNITGESTAFNVQQIRALFALDKLTRLAAYTPKHVSDQFEARFGFRPYAEDIHESKYIGSFRSDLQFSEVLSTAETTEGQLGAIGGRGYAVSDFQDELNFTSPEDGIIMGISYILPRISYDAFGMDKFNFNADITTFFEPTMQDLGLVPVYRKELINYLHPDDDHDISLINNIILGYQPNYSEYKIGVDKNHGLFLAGHPLSIFATHTKSEFMSTRQFPQDEYPDGVPSWFFYCSPSDMDSVFAKSYDGTELSDQFFGLVRFQFDVVQNMSVHGQPSI